MTARRLRPEKLVLTGEVMRVLKSEGLMCAEVVIGADGKGYIRFAPEAEFEGLVVHRETDVGTPLIEEVDYVGCDAVGVGGYHSDSYGEDGGRCEWCGLARAVDHQETDAGALEVDSSPPALSEARPAYPPARSPDGPGEHVDGPGCHCADCVPCVHHPGQDCDCYCRFCMGCGYGNCDFWVGPLLR